MNIVAEHKEKSFTDFLNNFLVSRTEYSSFIFRGLSSQNYELIPSALRNDKISLKNFWLKPDYPEKTTEYQQQNQERLLLMHFYKQARNQGLKIPWIELFEIDNSKRKDDYKLAYTKDLFLNDWLPNDLWELAALAQHYRIPTRLLDWSNEIWPALYFASSGAIQRIYSSLISGKRFNLDDNIVIWAMNTTAVIQIYPKLHFITSPYENNPNLHAQKGILTFYESDVKFNDSVDRRPLEQWLENEYIEKAMMVSVGDEMFDGETILHKIIFPYTECITIWKTLKNMGHNLCAYFPGYHGIATHLETDSQANYIENQMQEYKPKWNLDKEQIKANISIPKKEHPPLFSERRKFKSIIGALDDMTNELKNINTSAANRIFLTMKFLRAIVNGVNKNLAQDDKLHADITKLLKHFIDSFYISTEELTDKKIILEEKYTQEQEEIILQSEEIIKQIEPYIEILGDKLKQSE